MSGCSYHLAGMCAVLSGCAYQNVCSADLSGCVYHSFGRHVCSVRASECSYDLAGVDSERVCSLFGRHVCSSARMHLSSAVRARERVFLPFGKRGYSADGVRVSGCLPFGRHVCSSERVHLSGCAEHGFAKRRACAVKVHVFERPLLNLPRRPHENDLAHVAKTGDRMVSRIDAPVQSKCIF